MLGAAAALAAFYMRDEATSVRENESWRWSTPEASAGGRIANEEALSDCMDSWEGDLAVHTYPGEPELADARKILVDEASPLGKCLRIGDRDVPFCYTSRARPPADAHRNIPLLLGGARPCARGRIDRGCSVSDPICIHVRRDAVDASSADAGQVHDRP